MKRSGWQFLSATDVEASVQFILCFRADRQERRTHSGMMPYEIL